MSTPTTSDAHHRHRRAPAAIRIVIACALVGVACNALVGNREATPAPLDGEDACGAACAETGVLDTSAPVDDGGADVIIPYDGPVPIVHMEIFGDRPAAYNPDVNAPDAAYPAIFTWLPYQYRGLDLEADGGTLIVALDGFNQLVATSTNCINADCPAPTVKVASAGGSFRADLTLPPVDAGVFAYRIVSTSPPSLLHVPSGSDVCLVVHHPGWPTTRNVLVRVMRGDFDGDGRIEDGGPDQDVFTENFAAIPPAESHTDLNSDGANNGTDLTLFRSTIGTTRTLTNPCP